MKFQIIKNYYKIEFKNHGLLETFNCKYLEELKSEKN